MKRNIKKVRNFEKILKKFLKNKKILLEFEGLFDLFEVGFESEIRNEKLFLINVYQLQQIYRRFDKGKHE